MLNIGQYWNEAIKGSSLQGRLIFSQILHKSAVTPAEIGLRPLADRLVAGNRRAPALIIIIIVMIYNYVSIIIGRPRSDKDQILVILL